MALEPDRQATADLQHYAAGAKSRCVAVVNFATCGSSQEQIMTGIGLLFIIGLFFSALVYLTHLSNKSKRNNQTNYNDRVSPPVLIGEVVEDEISSDPVLIQDLVGAKPTSDVVSEPETSITIQSDANDKVAVPESTSVTCQVLHKGKIWRCEEYTINGRIITMFFRVARCTGKALSAALKYEGDINQAANSILGIN